MRSKGLPKDIVNFHVLINDLLVYFRGGLSCRIE